MYGGYYFDEMTRKLFGEFWDDDVKSETICFSVSKKSKTYFVKHADGKYGSTQKVMEHVFKKYMETINYKRFKVNRLVRMILLKSLNNPCF